jgi:methylglutaconyl-CoA hydratase
MTELVHLETANGVATITLDSPHNRNALSRQLQSELLAHLRAAIASPEVRVIVLTATGTVFCSGADLKEQREANVAGAATGPAALAQILETIWHSPTPVVGRINGPARAGGLGLVAACDISVGIQDTTFAIPEVRIGVIPAIISVILLQKIPLTTITELFLTGETFTGSDAVRYGLLNAAVPASELDAKVDRYVAAIRQGAPGALAGAKRLIRDIPAMDLHPAFEETARRSAEHFASEEAREGMTAFAEKRPPRWAGS